MSFDGMIEAKVNHVKNSISTHRSCDTFVKQSSIATFSSKITILFYYFTSHGKRFRRLGLKNFMDPANFSL